MALPTMAESLAELADEYELALAEILRCRDSWRWGRVPLETARSILATAVQEPAVPVHRTTIIPGATPGVLFTVRLVTSGQRYGLSDRLTHDGAPMIEFFDRRAKKHGPLGQFVARYFVHTLWDGLDRDSVLALDCGVPSWAVRFADVRCALAALGYDVWAGMAATAAPILAEG